MKNQVLFFIAFMAFQSQALEMTNPTSLCDRFLAEPEQKACEAKVSTLNPDWYLATTCGKQDDDTSFFQCLELTKTGNFAPLKLDLCALDALSDSDRINCIIAARASSQEAFQRPPPRTIPRSRTPRTSSIDRLPVGP